ncbi:MAG: cupin domain-containing protein [Candidatus Sulfotelmatobacter sp.]
MSSLEKCIRVAAVILCGSMMASHLAWGQGATSASHGGTKERARVVLSQELPTLEGKHLKAILVEVNYGPGEASPPHSHPCAVVGYVVEGILRTQVKGEPEMIYRAGESFYEAPNGIHLISANASATEPAKLVAYLLCDHDAPISVEVPETIPAKGAAQ